jgi:predicted membrane-bound spermidine synthase
MNRRSDPILLLFFVSGFSGLIYESVWSHYVKLFLGHAAYAQTLVLVVFIGGLALGAWLCARVAQRLRNPLRLYAAVEGLIGLVALAFHPVFIAAVDWGYASLLPATCDPGSTFCASQWLLSAALLAPQSILLGATFPLVCSAALRLAPDQPGHDIAALYFVNSFGAVLGVLASAFVLIPAVGLPGTLGAAGVMNLFIAAAAFAMSRVAPPALEVAPAPAGSAPPPVAAGNLTVLLLAVAFLTGLSSFIYEIVWIRMLSLVLGSSTHAFELMLASFILGLAFGGLWIRTRIDAASDIVRTLAIVQLVMGVAAMATVPVYNGAFDVMAWILRAVARNEAGFVLFNASSTAIALLVMLPATFCAGMTLPLITCRLLRSPTGERALGLVYAVNTLGAIVGVVIAVHLLLQWLGVRGALFVGAAIDVGLGVVLLSATRRGGRRLVPGREAIAGIVALALVFALFDVDPRRSSSGVFRTGSATLARGETVVFHRDGKTATIDVIESQGALSIRTNGKPDASIAWKAGRVPTLDETTMALLGILPLGHRPDARTAAVIGFGSGMTTSMLLGSPRLERVDSVEIEPAMVEGARLFRPAVDKAYADPRSRIVIDDAKSYFARGGARYDIIVSEPSNPWVSGVASLFTEEFYARLARHLNDGGVLSQWLHTYDMDAETLASIVSAVSKTFPDFLVYSSIDTDIILIARKGAGPGTFDARVLAFEGLQPVLERLKLRDAQVVKRRAVAGASLLGPFLRTYGATSNSDFHPVVEQRAPKSRFTQAHVNELVVLQAAGVPMLEMLGAGAPPSRERQDAKRVAYVEAAVGEAWAVRDDVLGTGRARAPAEKASVPELSARAVRSWARDCRDGPAFERILPSLVVVAESVNPHLHPAVAGEVWQRLGESPCAKALPEAQRRWLDLFAAVAQRDPARMVPLGAMLLDSTGGAISPASEYAFLATATALACRGESAAARGLLANAQGAWIREGERATERRLLAAMAGAPPACGPPPPHS